MSSDVDAFDKWAVAAFSSSDANERASALEALQEYRKLESWNKNLLALQFSNNMYSLQFAATTITDLFTLYHNRYAKLGFNASHLSFSSDRQELLQIVTRVMARLAEQFYDAYVLSEVTLLTLQTASERGSRDMFLPSAKAQLVRVKVL